MNTLTKSLIIGTILTFLLFGGGYLAVQQNMISLSYQLYWQGWLLGMLVPCKEIVILGHSNCEVTRLGVFAFYAGLPLGILVYSTASYILLRLYKRFRG